MNLFYRVLWNLQWAAYHTMQFVVPNFILYPLSDFCQGLYNTHPSWQDYFAPQGWFEPKPVSFPKSSVKTLIDWMGIDIFSKMIIYSGVAATGKVMGVETRKPTDTFNHDTYYVRVPIMNLNTYNSFMYQSWPAMGSTLKVFVPIGTKMPLVNDVVTVYGHQAVDLAFEGWIVMLSDNGAWELHG